MDAKSQDLERVPASGRARKSLNMLPQTSNWTGSNWQSLRKLKTPGSKSKDAGSSSNVENQRTSEDPEALFLADRSGSGAEAGVFCKLRHKREGAALESCQRIVHQKRPGDFFTVGFTQIGKGGA
jgi:hypothetical protein